MSKIDGIELSVLDVGSMDVNGTFRPLVEKRGWAYTGLDIAPGKNVDIVSDDLYHYPIEDNSYDVVISGSTMEHVGKIWLWVPELARVLKPGGWLCIHTHWKFQLHRHPVDCWRIMPDGMALLFDETDQLEKYEIRIANDMDIIGMARKLKPGSI